MSAPITQCSACGRLIAPTEPSISVGARMRHAVCPTTETHAENAALRARVKELERALCVAREGLRTCHGIAIGAIHDPSTRLCALGHIEHALSGSDKGGGT